MLAVMLDSDPSTISAAYEKMRSGYLEYVRSVICGPSAAETDAYESYRKVVKTSLRLLLASSQQTHALPRRDKGLRQARRNASCGFFGQAKVNGRNAP